MDQPSIRTGDDRKRLPAGTVLGDDIVIEGELGAGGFGITYKARDQRLGRLLAVKEYFPIEIGSRDSTMSVQPLTANQGQVFRWGLEKFIDEARMLAAFSHSGIVKVLRYFEAHSTAYMVLDYVEGHAFGKWLDRLGRPPTQAELDLITSDIAGALGVIHAEKLVHRDIAPDNIIIRPDGHAVLLDFGAARYELADRSTAYSRTVHSSSYAIVKAHYSPFEQRATDKRNRGAWSDVYALGATLYRAVTGEAPMDAMDRIASGDDALVPAVRAAKGDYRPGFLSAIDRALRIRHVERPQTIVVFLDEALGRGAPTTTAPPKPIPNDDPTRLKVSSVTEFDRWSGGGGPLRSEPQAMRLQEESAPARTRTPLIAAAAAVGLLLAGGVFWLGTRQANVEVAPPSPPGKSQPPALLPQPPTNTAAQWTRQHQVALDVISRLRATIDVARSAGHQRQWPQVQRMMDEAAPLVRDARSAIDRLRSVAQGDIQRQTTQDYLAQVDTLAGMANDLRAEAQRGIAREEDDRQRATGDARRREDDARRRSEEEQRRERELVLRQPPPPPRTFVQHNRRWVEGDGYNKPPPVIREFGACAALCVEDLRCRMFEHAKDDRTKQPICNLYDHTRMHKDPGNATVGIMR